MNEYRVQLDAYSGPMDLLLYLIRREEVDIYDIPIARVTEQYLQYVELLRAIDPEVVSEFLVLAATLMEIKSRMLLPTPPPDETTEEVFDPRLELVRQLLEYKNFKDAARSLDGAAELRALKYARAPASAPQPEGEIDLERVDIWDLFTAFSRLLEQTGQREGVHRVGIDDTPLALHAEDILDSLERAGGTQPFEEIFGGRTRAEMIGLFLALLELIRRHRVRATQESPFGTIWLHLLDRTPLDVNATLDAPETAPVAEVEGVAPVTPAEDEPELASVADVSGNGRTDGQGPAATHDLTEQELDDEAL